MRKAEYDVSELKEKRVEGRELREKGGDGGNDERESFYASTAKAEQAVL